MFDLHIHMVLDGANYRTAMDAHRPCPCDALIRQRLQAYAEAGILFLRDGGDAQGVSLRARELAGEYGIDYRTPAFPIHKNGHYGSFIGRGFDTMEQYACLLEEAERKNADFIKLMISGLIDFSKPNTLTEVGLEADEIGQMIFMAHARGFAVMAHANGDAAVNAALDAGVDSIEHGAFLSETTLLRIKKTMWVPTLSTIGNLIGNGRFPDVLLKNLLEDQIQKVRFAYDNGTLIGAGSDAGAYCVAHAQGTKDEWNVLSFLSDEHLEQAAQYTKSRFAKR